MPTLPTPHRKDKGAAVLRPYASTNESQCTSAVPLRPYRSSFRVMRLIRGPTAIQY
jgi:hypothetical protein